MKLKDDLYILGLIVFVITAVVFIHFDANKGNQNTQRELTPIMHIQNNTIEGDTSLW